MGSHIAHKEIIYCLFPCRAINLQDYLMIMKNDAVSKTIRTYEETAEDFYKDHSDISEIKNIADFFIKNLKGKKILDVGCGPGRDAKYFSEKGLDITGIDLTKKFIEMASKNAPKARFIRMDMRKIDFSPNTFDGIWSCASFLHLPKSEAKSTLREFRRILKPRALLYISIKEGDKEKFVKKDEYKGYTKLFAFYSKKELKNLIKSSKFNILKIIINRKKDVWINVFAIKQ